MWLEDGLICCPIVATKAPEWRSDGWQTKDRAHDSGIVTARWYGISAPYLSTLNRTQQVDTQVLMGIFEYNDLWKRRHCSTDISVVSRRCPKALAGIGLLIILQYCLFGMSE